METGESIRQARIDGSGAFPGGLQALARLPIEERHRVLADAIVEVDPEETKWWDAFDDAE